MKEDGRKGAFYVACKESIPQLKESRLRSIDYSEWGQNTPTPTVAVEEGKGLGMQQVLGLTWDLHIDLSKWDERKMCEIKKDIERECQSAVRTNKLRNSLAEQCECEVSADSCYVTALEGCVENDGKGEGDGTRLATTWLILIISIPIIVCIVLGWLLRCLRRNNHDNNPQPTTLDVEQGGEQPEEPEQVERTPVRVQPIPILCIQEKNPDDIRTAIDRVSQARGSSESCLSCFPTKSGDDIRRLAQGRPRERKSQERISTGQHEDRRTSQTGEGAGAADLEQQQNQQQHQRRKEGGPKGQKI